jgi:hypothetical protein
MVLLAISRGHVATRGAIQMKIQQQSRPRWGTNTQYKLTWMNFPPSFCALKTNNIWKTTCLRETATAMLYLLATFTAESLRDTQAWRFHPHLLGKLFQLLSMYEFWRGNARLGPRDGGAAFESANLKWLLEPRSSGGKLLSCSARRATRIFLRTNHR